MKVRYLFQYFMTCPATHMSGIYYVPMPTILYETGLTKREIQEGINTLSEQYMVLHDPENDVVWVVNMLKHQGWNDKIKVAVAKQLESLHETKLIDGFLKYYDTLSIPYRYPIDRVSSPEEYPIDRVTVSVSKTNTVSKTKEKEKSTVPVGDIIGLYHTILSELPHILEPTAVDGNIKARWREKKCRQSLEWWKALFERVYRADKLMGRVQGFEWRCPGLGWIVGPKNLGKILNGEYDNTQSPQQQGERSWKTYQPDPPAKQTPGIVAKTVSEYVKKVSDGSKAE